jgi:hypothetical protein
MTCRFSAGAVALALAASAVLAPARGRAQSQTPPIVINIDGPCALALNGQASECAGVAYMAFPDTQRIDFTAVTAQAGWAFSGEADANDDGHYTLTLDSVVSPQAGRIEAQGECDMDIAEDGKTVRSIDCRARTSAGVMQLKASGVARTGADDDDDDDDEDDGPETGQG